MSDQDLLGWICRLERCGVMATLAGSLIEPELCVVTSKTNIYIRRRYDAELFVTGAEVAHGLR